MAEQSAGSLLMVRPSAFRGNEQTAVNNFFQAADSKLSQAAQHRAATDEFDNLVALLRNHGIEVLVVQDNETNDTPDSIFPNNRISTHADGSICIYPMFAANRRRERRLDVIAQLKSNGFVHKITRDFSHHELQNKFLEGTGSLVLDRANSIAYASISERTHPDVLIDFCGLMNYKLMSFHAYHTIEGKRQPIYHTNVMMCVGTSLAVICAECIDDHAERFEVLNLLQRSGKEIVKLSEKQIEKFAGNMLEVHNAKNEKIIVMSSRAFASLEAFQLQRIAKHCAIIHSPLDTIETCGGGSARCMMAEIFLPRKS